MSASHRQYTYLCFELRSRELAPDCQARLERLGVECVQEAGPHRAYGIVDDVPALRALSARDPEVRQVRVESPPCGF